MPPRLLPRLCGALLATIVLSPLLPAPPAAAAGERTSAVEARRVDRVPTPRISAARTSSPKRPAMRRGYWRSPRHTPSKSSSRLRCGGERIGAIAR